MGIANDYIKPVQKILHDARFRTWMRLYFSLKSQPPKKEGKARFETFEMTYVDALSFIFQYKEIFVNEYYRFPSDRKDPFIIDCGGNIGMSCLYFKKLYPEARILTYEADPHIAALLEKNMQANHLTDVTVFHKAVWKNNEDMSFFTNGADGGNFFGKGEHELKVPAIRLKEVLLQQEQVDFLKIDIEGAETTVIKDCDEALQRVSYLYLEYHSLTGQKQDLGELLQVLEKNGFRYSISSLYRPDHPLVNPTTENNTMDLQLHVFGSRK